MNQDSLAHHGIKGQKWGIRRFQNPDGTLTAAGKRREAKDYSYRESKKFREGTQRERSRIKRQYKATRRIFGEKTANKISYATLKEGKSRTGEILKTIGKRAAITAASATALYLGAKMVQSSIQNGKLDWNSVKQGTSEGFKGISNAAKNAKPIFERAAKSTAKRAKAAYKITKPVAKSAAQKVGQVAKKAYAKVQPAAKEFMDKTKATAKKAFATSADKGSKAVIDSIQKNGVRGSVNKVKQTYQAGKTFYGIAKDKLGGKKK